MTKMPAGFWKKFRYFLLVVFVALFVSGIVIANHEYVPVELRVEDARFVGTKLANPLVWQFNLWHFGLSASTNFVHQKDPRAPDRDFTIQSLKRVVLILTEKPQKFYSVNYLADTLQTADFDYDKDSKVLTLYLNWGDKGVDYLKQNNASQKNTIFALQVLNMVHLSSVDVSPPDNPIYAAAQKNGENYISSYRKYGLPFLMNIQIR